MLDVKLQATISSLKALAADNHATIEQLQAQVEQSERSLAAAEHAQMTAWEAQALLTEQLDQSRASQTYVCLS